MRVAIGGFHIESCTFSPLLSHEQDFKVQRGKELTYPFVSKHPDIEFCPIVHAHAVPGGPVDSAFYLRIKGELIEGLRNDGPWDGVFLHLHGAAYVDGMEDAEGDLVAAVRQVAGDACLIAASYDLHGNLSQRVVDNLDILSAYRTAPHEDVPQTMDRTVSMLIKCVREKISPQKAFIPVPILLPGEQTSTAWEPAQTLYGAVPGVIDGDRVMDASILIGYVWADEPRSSASVFACGTDTDAVRAAAENLAQRFWDCRTAFKFGMPALAVDDCIRAASASEVYPVVISDSGDNPTAGGAGDVPFVLERLLAANVPDAVYASITDPAAVAQCARTGLGDVELTVGGKLDPVHGAPLAFTGRVLTVRRGMAVVQVGGVKVILTSRRTPFHRIDDFTRLNIDPHGHRIVVVKIGYLEPELKELAAKSLLALSPGAVNQDIAGLPYKRIRRPMFPFDGSP